MLSFIDCINRLDIEGLCDLMTADHELIVLEERPSVGRDTNRAAWRGYFDAFSKYVIYPQRFTLDGETVAILGSTTGSHLGLSDEAERALTVIWTAKVIAGRVASWSVHQDSPSIRACLGLA